MRLSAQRRVLAIASFASFVAPALGAAAQTRSCKWALSTIPVYVNSASFESRGYDGTRATQQVLNAINVWNSEGQANVRLSYVGDTTATSGATGRINVWAADVAALSGGCYLAITAWSEPGGVCDAAGIAVYSRGFDGCGHQPFDWTSDGPTDGAFQLADILVHEFGHAIGGYSDNYGASDTVMASTTWQAKVYHLYDRDIDLLRTGYMGSFGYGARTDYSLRNYWSTNGSNWNFLTTVGATNLKAGAAGNAQHVYTSFVDANSSTFGLKVVRAVDGASWVDDTGFASSSRVGIDLEATTNAVVLAFASGVNRDIKTRKRTATWGAEVAVSGATRVPPALGWNSSASRLVLAFVDRDSHRLKVAMSSDEGSSWSAPTFVGVIAEREFLATDGPAVSCDGSNQCLLVWPTFNNYSGITTSLCTSKFSMSGSNFSFDDHSCFPTNSGDTPGVAHGLNAISGWILGRSGRDSNTSLAFSTKTSYSVATDWSTSHVSTNTARAGVGLTFFPSYSEWEVFNVGP